METTKLAPRRLALTQDEEALIDATLTQLEKTLRARRRALKAPAASLAHMTASTVGSTQCLAQQIATAAAKLMEVGK